MRNGSEAPRHTSCSGFFGPKHSGQILGNALIWGEQGWGENREEFVPQAVSSCPCDPQPSGSGTRFPLRAAGRWGNWPMSDIKGDVSCPRSVSEETLGKKGNWFCVQVCLIHLHGSQLHWMIHQPASKSNCIHLFVLTKPPSSCGIARQSHLHWSALCFTYGRAAPTRNYLLPSKDEKKNFFCCFLLFIYYYKFIFYSSAVDLQCCGGFRCITKRFSYI